MKSQVVTRYGFGILRGADCGLRTADCGLRVGSAMEILGLGVRSGAKPKFFMTGGAGMVIASGSKTALLHIGTGKAGSTSIQECLYIAASDGNLGQVRYPLWKSDHQHSRLATLYQRHNELGPWWRPAYPVDDVRFQRMRRQFRRFLFSELRAANGAIISAENLSHFSPESVAQLRRDLEALGFNEFHIVMFVRDPADHFLSSVQQRLKSVYVEGEAWWDPDSYRYPFRETAENWEVVFPGSVIVRRFSNDAQFDVVDDFADLVKVHMNVVLPKVRPRMNTSLSAEAMEILQDYRRIFWPRGEGRLTPDIQTLVRFLERSADTLPQTKPTLKSELAEIVRANHRADAEFVLTRYGTDLGVQNRPVPSITPAVHETCSVDEIVDSVDPNIVRQLLLLFAGSELGRRPQRRPMPVRLGAFAYRAVPNGWRSARLEKALRAFARPEL